MKKICFKCNEEKNLNKFYVHKEMYDGHFNKCKKCIKEDVLKYRKENIKKIRQYDRERAKLPHRRAESVKRTKEYRQRYPEKHKAHQLVAHSLKIGNIIKQPCAVCNSTERIEAHHPNYSEPLNVVWLCSAHHSAVHYT